MEWFSSDEWEYLLQGRLGIKESLQAQKLC